MPRSRTLTQGAIADAALAVLDHGGLASLTMRAVAADLGVSAMALYRYVDSREGLERWIVDRVLEPVDVAVPADEPWTQRIVKLMTRLRGAIVAHPAAVPLMLIHRHSSPTSLRWIEAVLSALSEGGLTGVDRAIAQRSLLNYLLGSLNTQHLSSLSGSGTATMATLPKTDFPYIAETARVARRLSPDKEFRLGLAVVLRGLER
ncbi:TetR/AcrR family transcriptional regulator [Mycobacterium neumannii]|uniref:TetR/AcrR family transcriptional regulator n=1 Tax=Mycobacterium neumannii TaxID=2048551 RepID=UPI003AB15A56